MALFAAPMAMNDQPLDSRSRAASPLGAHAPRTGRELLHALYTAAVQRLRGVHVGLLARGPARSDRQPLDGGAWVLEAKRQLAEVTELQNANRLATVGRLTAGLAHEFGTPLGVVLARAQMIISDDAGPDEMRADAEAIIQQVKRMTQMCREVLDYARPRAPVYVLTDLAALARHMLVLLSPEARKRGVKLGIEGSQEARFVSGNESKLTQIVTNLIINALQAMPPSGGAARALVPKQNTVVLRIEKVRERPAARFEARGSTPEQSHNGSDQTYACFRVEDTGTGISTADLPHIFETFFTTKKEGEGTGLGLAVSSRIAHEHGGWIGVTSEEQRGSCFTLYLPLIEEPELTRERNLQMTRSEPSVLPAP
jgi:signal transduction histidine kinase